MAFLLSHIGLDLERVSAIDGAKLQFPIDDFDERGLRHRRRPNPYETGCFLGHAELVIRPFSTKLHGRIHAVISVFVRA